VPSSLYGIESYSDGWINLSYRYDEKTSERMRYVEVLKMKGVAHSSRAYPASISSHGFVVMSEEAPAQLQFEKPAAKEERPARKPAKHAPAPKPELRTTMAAKLAAAKSRIITKEK
jgi:KaiC/GvpD/RAD55 family RecA-like ATPase